MGCPLDGGDGWFLESDKWRGTLLMDVRYGSVFLFMDDGLL